MLASQVELSINSASFNIVPICHQKEGVSKLFKYLKIFGHPLHRSIFAGTQRKDLNNIENPKSGSRLSDFCRGSSFRVCCTPLDQILTTSEQLCKVP